MYSVSDIDMLANMNKEEMFGWFYDNARCSETLAGDSYYVRVGSTILWSDDTHLLWRKLRRLVLKHRRKRPVSERSNE